ncbi:zinc finger MYM-type protein 1-like [Heracleum sosnowskyi]|uniref:Zinc finger MYM-type protein 1-like n=1 Tax=Heracleum sosnowskyi TaxID=360622 RepID=A0AAD8ISU1_9APIA|nr:zinc finger MYM-type protein 1-like [Heracleum sosnowskyi]
MLLGKACVQNEQAISCQCDTENWPEITKLLFTKTLRDVNPLWYKLSIPKVMACASLEPQYQPPVTFVVVQKHHHASGSATPTPTPSDATPTHIHSADTPTHTPSATPTATSSGTATPNSTPTATSSGTATPSDHTSELDLASLERDPGLRRLIWKYPPNVRDDIRRLKNVTRHIDKVINCQSLEEVKKNRLRLRSTIEGVRYLSLQACALRGHDESSTSRNRGNLIEIVKTFGRLSPDISNVVLENAPKTSPKVQKDILHIFASKVRNKIRNEIGDSKFCILVDEALDASQKEQMAIVLRFVDVYGVISERFFDIVNVLDTTSLTLKKELSDVLTQNNLSIQNMRGQGYDGASNMRGAFNGLHALFLRDCPYAYYVHCFAHRLQLALVGAAEKQDCVWEFFSMFANVVNIVSGSSKHLSELQTAHGIEVDHSVASGERETGRGLSQIGNLQ